MIRAVLDTNVLVSALIAKGLSAPVRLYNAFLNQKFLLVTSVSILEETEEVINRKKIAKYHKLTLEERKVVIEQLVTLCCISPESKRSSKVIIKKDPEDDKFLHAAIEGRADFIVSGDSDLLDLKRYKGVKILSPKDFLEVINK